MDWPAFWTSFFASSGAAAVGFGSAAWLYARTRRAEREDAAANERRERVAAVQAAVFGNLAAVLGSGVVLIGFGVVKVATAVSMFATPEMAASPAVAIWAMERLGAMGPAVAKAERRWLLPGDATRRRAVFKAAADIATRLAAWEGGAIPDAWFAEHLSDDGRQLITAQSPRRRR